MEISITIIRTNNFSAKLIHLGMWLWCVLRGIKTVKTYNHCEVRFGDLTSGAISHGVKTRRWVNYWKGLKRPKRIDYNVELSQQELEYGLAYLRDAHDTPYEFANFFWHLVKIFTSRWSGSESKRKLYCYEHGIRFLNATNKYDLDPYMNPYEFKKWADSNLTKS